MATEHFSFRPTQEDLALLKRYAQETSMTMSDVIRRCLRLAGPVLVEGLASAARTMQQPGQQPDGPGPSPECHTP